MPPAPPTRQQISQTSSVPAPVGGLNARDSIAAMPPTDAILMDNWFPQTNNVTVRNGSVATATGLPGWVETLMWYSAGSTGKLFAASGGNIYDVTNSGAVGAPVLTGMTNNKWQYTNISTGGGTFIFAANGSDPCQVYNGTSWSAPTITGISSSSVFNVTLFKSRIWLILNNSLQVYYLPTSSIAGAASLFDLSPLFKLGGNIVGCVQCTIDNVGGINDFLGFVTSNGEIAMYQGSDPTSTTTWGLVGMFRTGRPIGNRFQAQVGADVIMVTANGLEALSKSFLTDRVQQQDTLSYKITNMITADVSSYANNFGWQPVLYPMGNKIMVNVPSITENTSYQYVMNTITGSWCRFTGWNATCFELFNDNLYYGGYKTVYQCDVGNSDGSSAIQADVQQAFSYFGAEGRQKIFTMCRPIFSANGQIKPTISIDTDFSQNVPTGTPTFSSAGGSAWNVSPWNTSPWAQSSAVLKNWQTISGIGFSASLRMRIQTSGIQTQWQATDFVYQYGGIL